MHPAVFRCLGLLTLRLQGCQRVEGSRSAQWRPRRHQQSVAPYSPTAKGSRSALWRPRRRRQSAAQHSPTAKGSRSARWRPRPPSRPSAPQSLATGTRQNATARDKGPRTRAKLSRLDPVDPPGTAETPPARDRRGGLVRLRVQRGRHGPESCPWSKHSYLVPPVTPSQDGRLGPGQRRGRNLRQVFVNTCPHKCRLRERESTGWAPDPLMGWWDSACASHPGVLGSIPKRCVLGSGDRSSGPAPGAGDERERRTCNPCAPRGGGALKRTEGPPLAAAILVPRAAGNSWRRATPGIAILVFAQGFASQALSTFAKEPRGE